MWPQLARFATLLLASALILSGCASRAPAVNPDASVQPEARDYRIGPGDTLNIIVWRNPEVSLVVPVRPDGKFSTPLVEDIAASGKTATALAREIETSLAKFIQDPVVTVVVTNFVGTYSEQIRVIGQAAKPQALPYRKEMSLLDVIIAVGGTTEFAAGNKANVIRNVDGQQKRIAVRLDDLMKDGDISANMTMRPGDILVIPESIF
ncbi:XrtA/PEP-CTERM system exopolysaccharide export protein [Herbaspirillum robiniae]|uniref:Sugar ABC transporter substrate-binding protein n=1 Tax=Herbaspirillum robiniae TaxID=2014887 RepID=A0A2D0B5Z0_9BURK|nr:XrtA/PEP-CTERM system exopolysaccharide export protein [Herbaspirillum robiniae]NUU01824.1 sugar ABC transporter substrate-binding protein [Herbaspirillum robiniae]OWY29798.1 sugar ABC transporter substrate-binding protein [Herbaspirillum robiniae]